MAPCLITGWFRLTDASVTKFQPPNTKNGSDADEDRHKNGFEPGSLGQKNGKQANGTCQQIAQENSLAAASSEPRKAMA